MRTITVASSQVVEFDAFKENGVLVAGFRFREDVPIPSIIIQIEDYDSGLEEWGYHVELDEDVGFYNGIEDVKYIEAKNVLQCVLRPPGDEEAFELVISVPSSANGSQRLMLSKLASRRSGVYPGVG